MVTHIVIFTWIAGTTTDQVADLSHALDRLAAALPDVAIRHGPDLDFREGNGDFALIASVADRAGWDNYQAHPKHKTFVQDFVTPILADRLTIQFQSAGQLQDAE